MKLNAAVNKDEKKSIVSISKYSAMQELSSPAKKIQEEITIATPETKKFLLES